MSVYDVFKILKKNGEILDPLVVEFLKIIETDGIGECHTCLTHNDFMSWVVWSDERECDLPRCMKA